MNWHLSRNWDECLLVYWGKTIILYLVPCIVSFSFQFLLSTFFSLSLLSGGFPHMSGDLWPSGHIEKETLKADGQLPVWLGLSMVAVTVRWPGGTLTFSLGSSFLWDCLVFPEKSLPVSCLEVVKEGGSVRGRQSHQSVIQAFTYFPSLHLQWFRGIPGPFWDSAGQAFCILVSISRCRLCNICSFPPSPVHWCPPLPLPFVPITSMGFKNSMHVNTLSTYYV